MSLNKLFSGLLLGAISAVTIVTAAPVPSVRAQAGMSCDQLWYARNQIYAREGFCFKTDRARAVFGPGCFPPFGALSGNEQVGVNALQYWERVRGCTD
ncbi:MAG: YARHG domain-containing protein [Methylovirgula sp.]|jgi:hypothetical protein